jgi:N-dimethylarginine dimethylaminohydrolase
MAINAQSETLPIRTLLLKHPRQAWRSQVNIGEQWRALRYAGEPDFARAVDEYDGFVEILRRSVPEILFLPEDGRTGLDSIYVRDAALVTEHGIILCRMGKELRKGEPEAIGDFAKAAGWPVLGAIYDPGTIEGGDIVWLDEQTLAVGHGYRTNAEGISQLREMTANFVREVVEVPLPHWDGPGDVLHLMSMLSPVDTGKLLVYSRLLPVPFRRWLLDMGFELFEVPEAEYSTMGCNVLAMAPGKCIALAGNPQTLDVLAKAGVEVWTFEGREICAKGAGGPTCLTRPLLRSDGLGRPQSA